MIKKCKECGLYVEASGHECTQNKNDYTKDENSCNHEWLIPSDKRTRCKRCGDDGWVSYDGKVHETYEACMNHDALSYGMSPLSLPQNIEPESSNEKIFRASEGGYYQIGEQVVYINANGTFKIKEPTQKVYAKTQTGHKAETTSVTSTPIGLGNIRKNLIDAQDHLLNIKEQHERSANLNWTLTDEFAALAFVNEALENWTKVFQLTTENVSEKPQTEAPETAMEFLSRLGMDAKKWTDEFLKLKPDATDFGVMIGWFSNAIMAGYDRANWANEKRIAELEAENDKLRQASEWHLGLYRQFEKTNEELTAENERTKSQLKETEVQLKELTAETERLRLNLETQTHNLDYLNNLNKDCESRLQIATDALETVSNHEPEGMVCAEYAELKDIARETLAKLRGEK